MVRTTEIAETQNLLLLKLANELKDLLGVRSLDLISMFCEMEPENIQQLRNDLSTAMLYYHKKIG